jgi:hypothetical protein
MICDSCGRRVANATNLTSSVSPTILCRECNDTTTFSMYLVGTDEHKSKCLECGCKLGKGDGYKNTTNEYVRCYLCHHGIEIQEGLTSKEQAFLGIE